MHSFCVRFNFYIAFQQIFKIINPLGMNDLLLKFDFILAQIQELFLFYLIATCSEWFSRLRFLNMSATIIPENSGFIAENLMIVKRFLKGKS